jgi:hypothetical protein
MHRLIIAAGEAWDQTGEEGIDCVPTRKTWKNNSHVPSPFDSRGEKAAY